MHFFVVYLGRAAGHIAGNTVRLLSAAKFMTHLRAGLALALGVHGYAGVNASAPNGLSNTISHRPS
jgi:hypothetical protein